MVQLFCLCRTTDSKSSHQMLPCKLRLFVAHAVPPSSEHNKFSCVAKRRSNVFSLQHKNLLREVVVVVHNKKFQPATRHLLCHRLHENAARITSSADNSRQSREETAGKGRKARGLPLPYHHPLIWCTRFSPSARAYGVLAGACLGKGKKIPAEKAASRIT